MPLFRHGKIGKQRWWTDAVNRRACSEKAYGMVKFKPGKKSEAKYICRTEGAKHLYSTVDGVNRQIGFRDELGLNDESLVIVFDLEAIARAAAQ